MKRVLGWMVATSVLAGLASTAWAQPCPCGGPGPGMGSWDGGPGGGPGALFRCILDSRDVALSADQRQSIETILEQGREEGRRFRDEARDLKDQFLKTFADPKVTADQVREMAKATRQHREDIADHHLEVLLKVRAVLTPEQLKKVPDVMEGCRPRGHGRHGQGR